MVKRAAAVLVAGLARYLGFPAITEVFASWPRLSTLDPRWFILAVRAQVTHFACTFARQRLALRTRAWFPVVTSQLAGNAITAIMPGGAAIGAAVQFRMLAVSGSDMSSAAGGLAAFSLLGVGGLPTLPVFVLPVIIFGAPATRSGRCSAGIIGMIPITPGGLGVIEASLTGLLVLAQVDSSQAVLATLTYRIASYWLPLLAGPVAYGLFRLRYRSRTSPPQAVAAHHAT